ncbi:MULTISPECIES: CRISPR-associated protein Csx3 [Aerosakkonema]|uniref:CRISPR-associated protein Csx3 n=1 Tax=Aerosakkonema TaxID=1246629 RepID=UPI0035BAE368
MNTIALQKQVELQVTELKTAQGSYQTLAISLVMFQELIKTDVLAQLKLPDELDLSREVILYGIAPTWLYANLVERCWQAPWIGCYTAPKNQIVVIQSRISTISIGDAIPVLLNNIPCPAILIGGSPDSGKSVLSNALRFNLMKTGAFKRVFVHRASWDGEGNWVYEVANRDLAKKLIVENEFRLHENPETAKLIPKFFKYHSSAVQNLREVVDLVLVDVGGKPQQEKAPLVAQCTHYIIISKESDEIPKWHELCHPTLQPLTVIHSVRQKREEVWQKQPFLEIIDGRWCEGEIQSVPDILLENVLRVLHA